MSLLYARVQREAMTWHTNPGEHHPVVHHVRDAGFAGHVDMSPDMKEEWGGNEDGSHGSHGGFDEDLYDKAHENVTTPEDEAHYEEHDDYPEDHEERRDKEYGRLKDQKHRDNQPDDTNDHVMNFVANHGTDSDFWHKHGTHGPVDIKNQPVWATQSHVSQSHLDKYKGNPNATTHKDNGRGNYLGDESPMMVTHNGRLHVTEGHHRVAAALQRGDSHITAHHYNADEHGGFPDSEGHMPDHEDYEEPWF
jgi:hypothetical protein